MQNLAIEDKELSLRCKTLIWLKLQSIYMPAVRTIRGHELGDETTETIVNSDTELLLPSALSPAIRQQLPIDFMKKYVRLRLAQLEDALHSLRRHLRRYKALDDHQKQHTAGTGVAANTRIRSAISVSKTKQELDCERYRAARIALLNLDPNGAWTARFKFLNESDVKPLPSGGPGQGTAEMTWIWKMPRCRGFELSILEIVGGPVITVRNVQEDAPIPQNSQASSQPVGERAGDGMYI